MENYKSDKPCIVCRESGDGKVTYHHLYTRKTYPEYEDEIWNKIPVCQKHHNEFHAKGTNWMAMRYTTIQSWIERNGWEYSQFLGKWTHHSR